MGFETTLQSMLRSWYVQHVRHPPYVRLFLIACFYGAPADAKICQLASNRAAS